MGTQQTALVAVESPIARDPRVRRQIRWLADEGFAVDCLAVGDPPPEPVRTHFQLGAPTPRQPWTTLRLHLFTSRRRAFRQLTLSRFPDEVRQRVRDGAYDLIVLNDRHFAPWVDDPLDFVPGPRQPRIHLDLHEYFVPRQRPTSLWRLVTGAYYRWARSLFGHPAYSSRSTVNSGIARAYESELGVAELAVVRNAPEYADLSPSPLSPGRIRVIHHGAARWDRGLREVVEAMRMLDERFHMTFMLLGDPGVEAELRTLIADLDDRVALVAPVDTESITVAIQQYDLEVMFYPPRTTNLELALPNKLFEAVQARLGLVVGQSPMMSEIVEHYGNGLVVEGWTGPDLANALRRLTAADVAGFKTASDAAARDLSAEVERTVFLRSVLGESWAGDR